MGRLRTAGPRPPGRLTLLEVAGLLEVEPSTVRHLERRALMRAPSWRLRSGHYRYDQVDLHQMQLVLAARSLRISQKELRQILMLWSGNEALPPPAVRAFVDERIAQISERIAQLQDALARLEALRTGMMASLESDASAEEAADTDAEDIEDTASLDQTVPPADGHAV